ncbi:MAG: four helix bundle protein [Microgenomates group bacterium]
MSKVITLEKLEIYQLSIKLSQISWEIYQGLDWQIKKIIGDQFIEATDSVGGNIAEGYGRFHYLDRIKFMYNARGSLLESRHWFERLRERDLIKDKKLIRDYLTVYEKLRPKLNSFIDSLYKSQNASFS